MKRFAIRMPKTSKTEVRIVGSIGAALDRAAHPVLGARFSMLAALAKVAVIKKGDAECSMQLMYHPGAEKGFRFKGVGSNMYGGTRRWRKSSRSYRQGIAGKSLRGGGSGFR